MKSILYSCLYLVAIVIANLLIAKFGLDYAFVVSFLFISFDFASRDRLHDAWEQKGLAWKMGLLIALGSGLSWLINKDAGDVARASFVAFAISATGDAFVYHVLRRRGYLISANASNLVAAVLDSFMFPLVLTGGFLPFVTIKQILAKVGGGLIWSWVLMDKSKRQDVLCRFDFHKYPALDVDMTHQQCPNCGDVWEYNPHWNV